MTFSVVEPRLKSVVKISGEVCVMVLLTPPADLTEAPSAVGVKVCTRDKAASNCWQPEGFLSVGVTRNSIGAPCATESALWISSFLLVFS